MTPAPTAATASTPHPDRFAERHLGPAADEIARMLPVVGFPSLAALIDATVPAGIRAARPLSGLPEPCHEHQALAELRAIAALNRPARSFLGGGFHHTFTPPVIQRCLFENPGWYTQYTPYQAEISQGRLEGLLAFQTMVCDLTGLPVANSSLLDEATAAAEALHLCLGARDGRSVFRIAADVHPRTIAVVRTRAEALGVTVVVEESPTPDAATCGVLLQYPGADGLVADPSAAIAEAHAAGALAVVATDLLALCLLKSPGELGADVALGSSQRFGVPLGHGGPHAAFFAVRDEHKRGMPGRLVGVSKDRHGNPALRLSLQTREQHIRREKATSNICTAQALLANMAAMYAIYHGPEGLKAIAHHAHRAAARLASACECAGMAVQRPFFDTVRVRVGDAAAAVARAAAQGINLRPAAGAEAAACVVVALDETVTDAELAAIAAALAGRAVQVPAHEQALPAGLARTSGFLQAPVFNRHHTETAMMRFLKRLENRDLSLAHSMIPLGSCTMKLNAAVEMLPVSWPEFAGLHPHAPAAQAAGYARIAADLERWLGLITALPAVSLQPNAGSQGEYAGLLAIRSWQVARGQGARTACLIPVSAHGTNPASAAMVGYTVVPVACDSQGNVDLVDLEAKAAAHAADLACLMITYPSTHGVFETTIRDACAIVHRHGGLVYMDGANMNAQVGITGPGVIGADVCHLNLHKTFAIPHGGGGPGMGPICASEALRPHLPGAGLVGPVSQADLGSASILLISWTYIRLMGAPGLRRATELAILNANYIAKRLAPFYPVLYTGANGTVAHECILDLRPLKAASGIEAEDVAKRLMDYGFHAPTLSFPVVGTLMVEPTESENLEELDRFCEAMIRIHGEILAVAEGKADRKDNPLKNAPHTAAEVTGDAWGHAYTREQAAFPAPWLREAKFWPAVGRVDNPWGDRNLVCTCAGMDAHR
ncbi:MAG: aminomethyl-transferring glycine dehydrogenase [Planctomycetes bacterium]|nr:aminomethyl-transferring glycine dehydrogenase [Planctomycetota bacterium]